MLTEMPFNVQMQLAKPAPSFRCDLPSANRKVKTSVYCFSFFGFLLFSFKNPPSCPWSLPPLGNDKKKSPPPVPTSYVETKPPQTRRSPHSPPPPLAGGGERQNLPLHLVGLVALAQAEGAGEVAGEELDLLDVGDQGLVDGLLVRGSAAVDLLLL